MRRLLIWLLSLTGIFHYYRRRQKSPLVLFWHDVANGASKSIEGESFPVELFKAQIRYLKKYYEIISIDEFYKRFLNQSFTNKEVVITFDDGYKNNLLVAAPILKKNNIPFTVFLSANNVENQRRFYISIPRLVIIGASLKTIDIPLLNYHKECRTNRDRERCANEIEYKIKYLSHNNAVAVSEHLISMVGKVKFKQLCNKYQNGRLLNWEEVKTLVNDYQCTIGSHSMDHCICHSTQDKNLVKQQIEESKQLIKNRTGLNCDYFAYPNGDYNDYSNQIVEANYKMGFSTERKSIAESKSIATIGRIGVPRSLILFKFAITKGF